MQSTNPESQSLIPQSYQTSSCAQFPWQMLLTHPESQNTPNKITMAMTNPTTRPHPVGGGPP